MAGIGNTIWWIVYKIADFLFGEGIFRTCVAVLIPCAIGPVVSLVKRRWAKVQEKIEEKIDNKKWIVIDVSILAIELLLILLVNTHYIISDTIIGMSLNSAEQRLSRESDDNCEFAVADNYSENLNSFVFDTEPSVGSVVSKNEKIIIYTTMEKEKIELYQRGELSREDMRECVLKEIKASYSGDGLYVGEHIDKTKINVTAIYSDGSAVEIKNYSIDQTVMNKAGNNTLHITWNNMTTNLVVEVREPVLTGIIAEYTGLDPVDGEELAAEDFSVTAVYSNGLETKLSGEDYTIDPVVVEEGSNNITVSYQNKKQVCKISALGKNDFHPIMESEPNDNFSDATLIKMPCKVEAEINSNQDADIYEVKLNQAGCVFLTIESEMDVTNLYLYDNHSTENIWESVNNQCDNSIGVWKDSFSINLSSGIYFLQITGGNTDENNLSDKSYTVTAQFTSADCSESKSHDSLKTAVNLPLDTKIKDQISLTERDNFYRFEVKDNVKILLSVESEMPYFSWWLYSDDSTKSIMADVDNEKDKAIDTFSDKYVCYLNPGVYFLRIACCEGNQELEYTGNYNFKLTSSVCRQSDVKVLDGSTVYGKIAANEECVKYKFKWTSGKTLSITFKTEENAYLEIRRENNEQVWAGNADEENSSFCDIELEKGNYYFIVYRNDYPGGLAFSFSF